MSDKPLTLGQRVMVVGKHVKGYVAYIGFPDFDTGKAGKWIGVILDEPKGRTNGTVRGHTYFRCQENYGVFVLAPPYGLNIRSVSEEQINYTI